MSLQWQKGCFINSRKLRENIDRVESGSYDLRNAQNHPSPECKKGHTYTTLPSTRTLLERVQNFERKEQGIHRLSMASRWNVRDVRVATAAIMLLLATVSTCSLCSVQVRFSSIQCLPFVLFFRQRSELFTFFLNGRPKHDRNPAHFLNLWETCSSPRAPNPMVSSSSAQIYSFHLLEKEDERETFDRHGKARWRRELSVRKSFEAPARARERVPKKGGLNNQSITNKQNSFCTGRHTPQRRTRANLTRPSLPVCNSNARANPIEQHSRNHYLHFEHNQPADFEQHPRSLFGADDWHPSWYGDHGRERDAQPPAPLWRGPGHQLEGEQVFLLLYKIREG